MSTEKKVVLVLIPPRGRTVLGEANLGRLDSAHPRVRVEQIDDPERFAVLAAEADGIIVWPDFVVPPAALRPGGRPRWVQSVGAGLNRLLTPELVAADHVTITASKGPMGPLMAEHVVLLMLALARDLPGFLQDQTERRWRFLHDERPMAQLFGKTILILGVGAVGGCLARLCQVGFGMRVLGLSRTRFDHPHVDRYVERADLHAALAEADVVAVCLALTPTTERIIDAAALAAMKPTATLINVTRGGLVDEPALIAALRDGRIAGAGLDVAAVEPLPPDSPLWSLPNVIITPHVSAARDRIGEHIVDFWCDNIRRFAEGAPLRGIVDRQAGY
jgi:phosphoglycerate dehydrogenase-like enzyme